MSRFHINPKGEPGKCSAQSANCPFGGEHQHYGSEAKARVAFELSMASEALPTPSNGGKGEDEFSRREPEAKLVDPEKARANQARSMAYPKPGDNVVILPTAAARESSMEHYVGAEGEIIGFSGTYYEVAFRDDKVRKIHWQDVKGASSTEDDSHSTVPAMTAQRARYVERRGQ